MKKIPSHDALASAGWESDGVNAGDLVTVTHAYAGHVSTQRGTKLQQEYFLNEQRQRQAKGLFTVCEVAQYFEDYSFVPDAAEFLNKRLIPAIESKELRVMSESDGFQVRGRSVNVMGDCLRPVDVNKWLDKEGVSFRWNVDTTTSPASLELVNGRKGRTFPDALEQPAYQKTPEYQAEYAKAGASLVAGEIGKIEKSIKQWKMVSALTGGELKEREREIAGLSAKRDELNIEFSYWESRQPAPAQSTATPAPLVALEAQRGYVLALPSGQSHVQFGELAHLIADALWPDAGADDTRMTYGFSRVNLDVELVQAVKAGTLQVKDPLTFGPHTFPVGNALLSALVTVDDLREFVAARGLTVETAQTQATTPSPAPVVPVGATGDVARVRAKRRTWRDVAWPYMVEVVKAGQYKTGKEFYQALKSKAGTADSPFDRGTGHHRDVLFVREISETLALKTIQTYAWKELKASRKTG